MKTLNSCYIDNVNGCSLCISYISTQSDDNILWSITLYSAYLIWMSHWYIKHDLCDDIFIGLSSFYLIKHSFINIVSIYHQLLSSIQPQNFLYSYCFYFSQRRAIFIKISSNRRIYFINILCVPSISLIKQSGCCDLMSALFCGALFCRGTKTNVFLRQHHLTLETETVFSHSTHRTHRNWVDEQFRNPEPLDW